MTQHPNTVAALFASAITLGAQWLVQRYAHVALPGYWQDAVTSAVTVATLYVGRAGVKAALARVWNGPKKAWAGTTGSANPKAVTVAITANTEDLAKAVAASMKVSPASKAK